MSVSYDYRLVLTSQTGDNGSQQYFIKGTDNNLTDLAFQDESGGGLPATAPFYTTSGGIPEPATWTSMRAAGPGIILSRRQTCRA